MKVAQQLSVANAKLAPENSSSRLFDAALLIDREALADQNTLGANLHRLLDALL